MLSTIIIFSLTIGIISACSDGKTEEGYDSKYHTVDPAPALRTRDTETLRVWFQSLDDI
jgi:uncharacterized lipoprotein